MAICILTHSDIRTWENTGRRPACEFHHHLAYHKAEAIVKEDNAFWIPGQRAIVMFKCVDQHYVWKGKMSGGICSVMQFVSIKPGR